MNSGRRRHGIIQAVLYCVPYYLFTRTASSLYYNGNILAAYRLPGLLLSSSSFRNVAHLFLVNIASFPWFFFWRGWEAAITVNVVCIVAMASGQTPTWHCVSDPVFFALILHGTVCLSLVGQNRQSWRAHKY